MFPGQFSVDELATMPLILFRWWQRHARIKDIYTEMNMIEAFQLAQSKKAKEYMDGGIREMNDLRKGITPEQRYKRNFDEFVLRARGQAQ